MCRYLLCSSAWRTLQLQIDMTVLMCGEKYWDGGGARVWDGCTQQSDRILFRFYVLCDGFFAQMRMNVNHVQILL